MFRRRLLGTLCALAVTTAWIPLGAADAFANCVRVVDSTVGYTCNPNDCGREPELIISAGVYVVDDDDDNSYWRLRDDNEYFWVSTSDLPRRPDGAIDDRPCWD
jgi:hypothetical protein